MKEVRIELMNTDLEEMGIDQPSKYTPLKFNESHFIGYWISSEGATLTFYVGAQTFMCRNCQKNIDLFESILTS
jgi:hypothetical protein